MRSTWVQPCFNFFTGQSHKAGCFFSKTLMLWLQVFFFFFFLHVLFVVPVNHGLTAWRSSSSVSRLVGSLQDINTFSNLFIFGYTLHTHHHSLLLLLTVRCPKYLHIKYLVIVDCTHTGSASASFEDLTTLHRRTQQIV